MNFIKNLKSIYTILPFSHVIKNKTGLFFSILIDRSNFILKLDNNVTVNFKSSQFNELLHFLGIISYSISYSVKQKDVIEFNFDTKNKFAISLNQMSSEEQNLLELLFLGTRYGVNFVTNNLNKKNYRDKTIKIYEINKKKIVETSNGIKFYLDSIHPGNTIVETFVNQIHLIKSLDRMENKIVLDVGAECGDTALFYASRGAKVYAFEPIKNNFNAMLRNLKLNPSLAERIIPINAAIGEDKILKFYQDHNTPDIGASFVYNKRGKNAKIEYAKGYSLNTALKEFEIKHVDLLKTDCKGCEFFITKESLNKVDRVKIEYVSKFSKHKLEDLLNVLKSAGFDFVIYRINPLDQFSNRDSGHIYGEKDNL